MNYELLYIDWNPSIEAFHIGSFAVRWYSLCWVIGLASVYLLERYLFKKQKVADEKFEPLFIYCFLGILIGARLGHCIFYEPGYYLTSWHGFVEMLLPIKFVPEGWKFVGYEGLASHGGTLGLILALLLYVKRTKLPTMFVLDNISIVTPICACAIRMGNLMNSEIIGRVTDAPWAFIFHYNEALTTVDEAGVPLPRHPGQLYEAICYAVFFFVGWYFYKKSKAVDASQPTMEKPRDTMVGSGFYFGQVLALIFTARFFIEFTKEVQGGVDNGSLPIDMGQILSLPFIAIGCYYMFRAFKKA